MAFTVALNGTPGENPCRFESTLMGKGACPGLSPMALIVTVVTFCATSHEIWFFEPVGWRMKTHAGFPFVAASKRPNVVSAPQVKLT